MINLPFTSCPDFNSSRLRRPAHRLLSAGAAGGIRPTQEQRVCQIGDGSHSGA